MATYVPPGEKFFLKSVGASRWMIDEDWFDHHPNEAEVIHFTRQPQAVRVSHQLVYYAAGYQKIFGVVEVMMKAELDPEREADPELKSWAWASPVRPYVIIRSFDRAPSLDVLAEVEGDVAKWHKFVQQMDYRDISEDVFNHAAQLLVAAADPSAGDILDPSFAAEHGRRMGPDRGDKFTWHEGDVDWLPDDEAAQILGNTGWSSATEKKESKAD